MSPRWESPDPRCPARAPPPPPSPKPTVHVRHRCAFGLVARSRGLIRNFQAREQGESVVGQLVHALVILGKISVYNVCPKKM